MTVINTNIDICKVDDIIKKLQLGANDKVQKKLTQEILRRSDKYVPADGQAILSRTASINSRFDEVIYKTPYARYHWFGKKMIGPAPKTLTNEDMVYRGAPLRGPFWVERMWQAEGEEIIDSIEKYVRFLNGK